MINEPAAIPDARFNSPEAKRVFYSSGIALILASLALQFVIFWVRGHNVPAAAQAPVWLEGADGAAAVLWQDKLWFPSVKMQSFFGSTGGPTRLIEMMPSGPKEIGTLTEARTWLMPREDGLWIFASNGVSRYADGKFETISPAATPVSDGPPVLWEGKPAFAALDNNLVQLSSFDGKTWAKIAAFGLAYKEETKPNELRMIMAGDKPVFFARREKDIYSYSGLPEKGISFPADWQKVGTTDTAWAATVDNAGAKVFGFMLDDKKPAGELIMYSVTDKGWTAKDIELLYAPPVAIGVVAMNPLRLFYQCTPWSLNVATVESGAVTKTARLGRFFSLSDPAIKLYFNSELASLLLVILLLLAFWSLMVRMRPRYYTLMGPPIELASLPRRALALAIDAVILFGPLAAGMVLLFRVFAAIEETPPGLPMLMGATLLFIGMGWVVIGFFLICFLQGKYGRTPGKWLMRIRVVTLELRPCGFRRSFLRTIFLIADSLLNFTLGIGLIAFGRYWQRMGDVFSRTIVIRDSEQIYTFPTIEASAPSKDI